MGNKILTNEFIYFRYANHVSVGDEVLIDENNKIIPTTVFSVSTNIMEGEHFNSESFVIPLNFSK